MFASDTTTSRDAITIGEETFPKLTLFEATKPAAGFGARIMLNRTGRLNLTMDMAFGQNGAKGFYFRLLIHWRKGYAFAGDKRPSGVGPKKE